jgi:pimeloyl-ACP methyl ester carboxylesterase
MPLVLRLLRRRSAILTALACALAVTSAGATSARAATRPTVVLVHGACANASSWHGVVLRLEKAGYPVMAPPNPLRGVASDAAYLADLLATIKGPIVLVGHSYGGMITSVAAAGNPKVKSLVYVDAQIPLPGETAGALTNQFPGSQFGKSVIARPFAMPGGASGTDLYVDPAKYRGLFTGPTVTDAEARAQAAEQSPIAQSAFSEPASAAAWQKIPSWDVIGTKDRAIPPAAQRFMAKRAKAKVTEIPASHASMIAFPGAIAKVIEEAAK